MKWLNNFGKIIILFLYQLQFILENTLVIHYMAAICITLYRDTRAQGFMVVA